MVNDIDGLRRAVQRNCHISDANFAQNYTLCIYLLKMRELYRWEMDYDFQQHLEQAALGAWLSAREALWDSLEGEAYGALGLDNQPFAPFDDTQLNRELIPGGYYYGGGYGQYAKPLFFLAELEQITQRDGATLIITGRELARDIVAPAAMSRDNTIVVRRESLRRMVWEKIEEWRWKAYDNAMGRALAGYGYRDDPAEVLDVMTASELETVILHELGELRAGERLGEAWPAMVMEVAGSRSEYYARAVRDLLADTLSTLPRLLERENHAALHFYMANLSGIRRELFPSLVEAYQAWCNEASGTPKGLLNAITRGRDHWWQIGERMIEHYRRSSATIGAAIEAIAGDARL